VNLQYAKEADLVSREIAGETIIVPIRGRVGDLDSIYTLNEVGASIWNLLDGRTTVSQIVEAICQDFDVTVEEARKDALEFLETLKQANLIRPSGNERPEGP